MIDGSFEGQRVFTVAEQKRAHDDAVTKNDFAIVARLRFGQNLLILLVWWEGQANRDKVQAIQERRIVVVLVGAARFVARAWIERMSGRKFAQHVVRGNLGLLNGGKPLS